MSLGEYKSRGAADTRLLLHLNGNTVDSSGNGNDGNSYDISYSNGRLVKYAYFNGSSSYIKVTNHSSLNIRDAITVSLWFNSHEISGSSYIVTKWSRDNIAQRQYILYLPFPNMKLIFEIQTSSGLTSLSDTEVFETNKWKYVTGVYDGSTVKLYVDGVLKNQTNTTGQIVYPYPRSDLGIGALINLTTPDTSYRFYGDMDELIIESRAWSDSEIKRYYTYTLGKFATI